QRAVFQGGVRVADQDARLGLLSQTGAAGRYALLEDPELLRAGAFAAPGLHLKAGRGLRIRDVEAEPGAVGDPRLDRIQPEREGISAIGAGGPVPAFVAFA